MLIRSTLSSLPIYYLSLFSKTVFMGRGGLEKNPHLIKWAIVCPEKRKRGLGLRNFSKLNKALLCKWS